mgnify:FL=1
MVYLFTGEDAPAKQERISSLKKEFFPADTESFNYDSFSAKELTLPSLKELLSRLPVSAKQRLLVIKDILKLKPDIQEYLLSRLKDLPRNITLILDVSIAAAESGRFMSALLKSAKVINFRNKPEINAFDLGRAIERKSAERALNILADLFANGERPERILGALRYQFVRPGVRPEESRDKIRLLLETDNNLKTGRIKPVFALEALVVRLCRV